MNWISAASDAVGVSLKPHVDGQAVGACPNCRQGQDRFVVFVEGNYWCRTCNTKGWWRDTKPTKEELEKIKEEKRRSLEIIHTKMSRCSDWIKYHDQVSEAIEIWFEHGVGIDSIMRWGLGYCKSAPLAPDHESLTIPVFYRGRLIDIRHRIIGAIDGNKYRSHVAGLTPPFFNLDAIASGKRLYVVEGEKKAIVLMAAGVTPCISYPGIGFAGQIASTIFGECGMEKPDIVFIPDPGSTEKIEQVSMEIATAGHKCFILDLFDKPDDFMHEYGANSFFGALKMVRKIGHGRNQDRSR